jgi:hypothetical protein
MATKVPGQCPFVLLLKVGCRGCKTFRSEEGKDEKYQRNRLSRSPLQSIRNPNSDIKPWEGGIW